MVNKLWRSPETGTHWNVPLDGRNFVEEFRVNHSTSDRRKRPWTIRHVPINIGVDDDASALICVLTMCPFANAGHLATLCALMQAETLKVIEECNEHWKNLMEGKTDAGKMWIKK